MNDASAIALTLYVTHLTPALQAILERDEARLREALGDRLTLSVVSVLDMPEQALAHDVFTTPTLTRSLPPPVMHILGELSRTDEIVAALTTDGDGDPIILS